jgi:hypothetical protein
VDIDVSIRLVHTVLYNQQGVEVNFNFGDYGLYFTWRFTRGEATCMYKKIPDLTYRDGGQNK